MSGSGPIVDWATARATRSQRGHETRADLLDAAEVVFTRLGYARTTVADITAEAEVSRPTFYAYFSSKEELFAEVAAHIRDVFLAAHEIDDVDESDPYELGLASTRAFLAAYCAHGGLLTVIEHQAIANPAIAKIWSEIQQRPTRRVARYIRRLVDSGQAAPAASPEVVSEAIVGMIARFGQDRPQPGPEFDGLAVELNALYLRLLGITMTPADPGSTATAKR